MLPRPSSRKHRMIIDKELQITAFLNLMVILVPFLLVTAVFTRVAAIELSQPADPEKLQQEEHIEAAPPEFSLIVTIMEEDIGVLNDRTPIGIFHRDEKGAYDFAGISDLLKQLKQQYPEATSVLILSKPLIPYNILIMTIDIVREGFPDISLNEL